MNLRKRLHRRSGVALLVAITSVAILTVIVTEITYIARMRQQTANNQKDRVQAYWIAKSGVGIYQLILSANKELGKNQFIQEFGLGDSLWQMVPVINTGIMRMLFVTEAPGENVSEESIEEFKEDGTISEEVTEASRDGGVFNRRNFLDFEGDFTVEVKDTESKIDINQMSNESGTIQESTVAQRLYALMGGEENDQWFLERNIDRWEIIGNIKDWVDNDSYRSSGLGGQEDSLYVNLDPPYMTKNAKFDSTDEIRLVDGWNGEVYEKFSDKFTIWSNGKFNLNSFDEDMHRALIRASALTQPTDSNLDICFSGTDGSAISMWDVASFNNANDYATFILNNCGIELDKSKITNITKTSNVFIVNSTGMVGTSSVTITTVLDYTSSAIAKTKYYRIE
jgi:general secretion pathway protein K